MSQADDRQENPVALLSLQRCYSTGSGESRATCTNLASLLVTTAHYIL
jgi:hypothetical protein